MNTLSKSNSLNVPASWAPLRELEELQDRLTSFFGRRLPLVKGGPSSEDFSLTNWAPRVDIAEDDKEYEIDAEVPGVKKEDVKVAVENGVLSSVGSNVSLLPSAH